MKKNLNVGSKIKQKSGQWSFKNSIVKNFEEHIDQSIPYYKSTHDIFARFSDFFVKKGSIVCDLGCSTGTFLRKIQKRHQDKSIKYIGYDNQKKMIQFAKKKTYKKTYKHQVSL